MLEEQVEFLQDFIQTGRSELDIMRIRQSKQLANLDHLTKAIKVNAWTSKDSIEESQTKKLAIFSVGIKVA